MGRPAIASRIQAAKLLTEILQKVVMENSLAAWQRLFNFARGCFMKPKRAGEKSKSLASVVERQIKDFAKNDVPPGNLLVNKERKNTLILHKPLISAALFLPNLLWEM